MSNNLDEELLGRYFAGHADADDLSRVDHWLQGSSERQKELEGYHKIWLASEKQVMFKPDTNKAWEKVAAQTVNKKKQNYTAWAAAIAACLLLGTYFILSPGKEEPIQYAAIKTEQNQTEHTLADGSIITLNSFSHLEYPEHFEKDERRVKLIGEAFFDIARNPDKPFIIEANGTEIKVLGTSFNVLARDADVKVSVNSGRVEFKKSNDKKVVLNKGEEALYQSLKDTIKTAIILDRNVFAFKTKVFEFNQTQLEDVIHTLNKGYVAEIKLDGSAWENYQLTTRFENEKLSDALGIIAETLDLKLSIKDKTYILAKKE
ncbi:FecR family protein [Jiulongibacter sediminis]|jgi:ferric-dicitrate binding protein FerR (iron transport regulator)|uniref:FecR family protein n=1 Tax=Jiulongibacter sediminis TaxID=1605367 RepID=UPI0026EDB4BD|nr:FecR domain-containing protein [Jiulongibacter sediminis]